MSLLQNSNAIESGGYPIQNSLRFQAASSQYLSRTFSASGTTVTWSFWVKRGALGTQQYIYGWTNSANTSLQINFEADNTLNFVNVSGGVLTGQLATSQVFRDPSAWYHIVMVIDSTQATASNRLRLYVNGSQVTAFSTATYPSQNASLATSSSAPWAIGARGATNNIFFDGYMTEINFIDGQALTPSSFGETNTLTGQWVAKKYTGTYGTNGFYLPFSNGTSTTTLGADSSGNGNNWTLTNFTRSAGVSDCWMKDVPSGNGGASGTQPASNYAVLNPILENGWWAAPNRATFQRANLRISQQNASGFSTFDVNTNDKWYFEVTSTTNQSISQIVISAKARATFEVSYTANGQKVVNGSGSAYGASWTNGDTIGIAIDRANNQITFYKNGTSQGAITNTFPALGVTVLGGYYSENTAVDTVDFNFGQRSFAYTPPSGYKALCTANLPASTIVKGNQYMDATLFTGSVSGGTVTNAGGFQPDFVWRKARDVSQNHGLYDVVRGGDKELVSNSTAAEGTNAGLITSFNSNGFTYGNAFASANSYVAWQWDAGSSTVTNTSGTISSQVRANPTAGVSVVTLTTQASGVGTYGHGLGVAPKMIIYKFRNVVGDWSTYHESLGNTKYIFLNTTGAAVTNSIWWNNTSPTSSVVTLGSAFAGSQPIVAYCFAEIAGFSKFGSYNANGNADGPFNYTGFRPKFVMIKRTDSTESWIIEDSSRTPYNGMQAWLYPNLSNAEGSGTTAKIDFLSNGFKLRNSADGGNIGGTYIYMAFAESPFQNSNSR